MAHRNWCAEIMGQHTLLFIGTCGSRSMHDKMYDTYTIHPEEYTIEYGNLPENMVNIPENYGMFNIFQFGEDCLTFPKFRYSICSRMTFYALVHTYIYISIYTTYKAIWINYNHLTAPSLYG